MLEKLRKLSESDFDKENMDIKVHKSTVSVFGKEAKSGKDADAKSFSSKTLPTLKEHPGMAVEMTGRD
jgi:putative membrane protein